MITSGSFPESVLALVQKTERPEISAETARNIFYLMYKIRAVEEKIAELYPQGKMRCPTHLSIGQEAVPAVLGTLVRTADLAISTHRGHAHYIGKGGSIDRMMAEIYGKVTGCSRGKGGSMHLIDLSVGFEGTTAIVGNSIPIGVGLALGEKLKGTDNIVCIFVGDGAIEEGAFYEAANFAVLRKLPVFFVCENNFYSVYSHLRTRQPSDRQIFKLAAAIGLEANVCDGNDVIDTYEMTRAAIEKLRSGAGPQFIEYYTYRWREHCGPNFDNDIGYRSEEEYLAWKKRDPVELFRSESLEAGWLKQGDIEQVIAQVDSEVEKAVRFAEESEFPAPSEAYLHVFKEL